MNRLSLYGLAAVLAAAPAAHAQFASGRQTVTLKLPLVSQPATVSQQLGLTRISVVYSRPQVNGRKIWGGIVPYNQPWRAGANENTTLEATDNLTVEGKPLPAGIYGVHMIPGEDSWTVIFSRNHTSWGSFTYDEKEDALRVAVKPRPAEFHESLTYEFAGLHPDSTELVMSWEKVAVPVRIAADVNAVTVSAVRNQLRDLVGYTWFSWADGAEWLLDHKYELNQALTWIDQAVRISPEFQTLEIKSRILSALGKEDEAAKFRKDALARASLQEFFTYARGLQLAGKQQEGLALLREVATRDPDHWICHLAKARVLSSEKKFADAAKEAKAALAGSPQNNRPQIQRLIERLEKGEDINS